MVCLTGIILLIYENTWLYDNNLISHYMTYMLVYKDVKSYESFYRPQDMLPSYHLWYLLWNNMYKWCVSLISYYLSIKAYDYMQILKLANIWPIC